ncbi:MlaE family lipid ABC transporter permease subunit [Nitratifractor sp.]
MKRIFLTPKRDTAGTVIVCKGEWDLYSADQVESEIRTLSLPTQPKACRIDFSGVDRFDSAGIVMLLELKERLEKHCESIALEGLNERQQKMLELLAKGYDSQSLPRREENLFAKIGRHTVEKLQMGVEFLRFLGEFSAASLRVLLKPHTFRLRETVYHIEHSGVDALFIIALTSILVGLVIAYQTLVQLQQFGADIYVVDAIGIAITRELGPMITAIVIAGRSASSYAAEIGTMKLTEEISAMETMGFDPYTFLVVPRIVALIVAMPLLIFFADIMGILGGMLATKIQVDISFLYFLQRLQEVLAAKHYILGIIKGPFFALIIAATGCFHGFRVTGDTESIGIETTASVVHAIFFVIACDAVFSVIYTQLGY